MRRCSSTCIISTISPELALSEPLVIYVEMSRLKGSCSVFLPVPSFDTMDFHCLAYCAVVTKILGSLVGIVVGFLEALLALLNRV